MASTNTLSQPSLSDILRFSVHGLPKAAAKAKSDDESDDDADDSDDDDDSEDDDATGGGDDQDDSEDDDDESDDDDEDDDSDSDDDDESDDGKKGKFKAPKSQAELDRIIQRRVERAERAALAKARKQLAEDADRDKLKKSRDFEKLNEKLEADIEKLQEQLNEERTERFRSNVAKALGLKPSVAALLVGDTEAAMTKHGRKLIKDLGIKRQAQEDQADAGVTNRGKPKRSKSEDEKEEWEKPGFFTQS